MRARGVNSHAREVPMTDANAQGQITVLLAAVQTLMLLHPAREGLKAVLLQNVEGLTAATLPTSASDDFFQGMEHAKECLLGRL
jgi:hypothetical protein